jgi:hypothetical protein
MTQIDPAHFLANTARLLESLDSGISPLNHPWFELGATFRRNLLSVMHTAELPFRFLSGASARLRFQRLCFREQERSGKKSEALNRSDVDAITTKARMQLHEELKNKAEMESDTDWVLTELEKDKANLKYRQAHEDLMRQCLAATWSALEVLARDSFEKLIEAVPSCLRRLCNSSFGLEKLGKNLCNKILGGSIPEPDSVTSRLNFNNLDMIRSTYLHAVDAREDARLTSLGSPALDLLFQRRHLIVHKRGVVDASYLKKGSSLSEMDAGWLGKGDGAELLARA